MMPEKDNWIDRFISHLETLREQEERGALAALRRGLGSPLGTVPAMYPHILPWAPQNRRAEDACYIVGSLFALHPEANERGNLGTAFKTMKSLEERSGRKEHESLEKRFVALLNCNRDDLPYHLRQAVSLLKAKDVPVNWQQLLRDILNWDHEARFVQQKWAREFWQGAVRETEAQEEEMATS